MPTALPETDTAGPQVRSADPDAIEAAIAALKRGRLVGIPTETVYGLGADATNGLACARIFEAKGRPRFNPLIAHCDTRTRAEEQGVFTKTASRLAEAFWPGPLTLVVGRRATSRVCDLVTAGLDTLALRVPASEIMQALVAGLDAPVAAPSANRSGHVSATTADAVAADLGDTVALVLDAGASPVGLESTIIDVSGDSPRLLRPGGLARDEIEAVLGRPLLAPAQAEADRPAAPGMLAAHYAPSCPVRPNAETAGPGDGYLQFGAERDTQARVRFNLSPTGDLREAAANLFAALRQLDAAGVSAIAVAPIPETGLGEAINDRLRRASLGRTEAGSAS
ncbi:MAG: L-threonylcarbamoyladenylate synthase [Pseudomonadota bacterium]